MEGVRVEVGRPGGGGGVHECASLPWHSTRTDAMATLFPVQLGVWPPRTPPQRQRGLHLSSELTGRWTVLQPLPAGTHMSQDRMHCDTLLKRLRIGGLHIRAAGERSCCDAAVVTSRMLWRWQQRCSAEGQQAAMRRSNARGACPLATPQLPTLTVGPSNELHCIADNGASLARTLMRQRMVERVQLGASRFAAAYAAAQGAGSCWPLADDVGPALHIDAARRATQALQCIASTQDISPEQQHKLVATRATRARVARAARAARVRESWSNAQAARRRACTERTAAVAAQSLHVSPPRQPYVQHALALLQTWLHAPCLHGERARSCADGARASQLDSSGHGKHTTTRNTEWLELDTPIIPCASLSCSSLMWSSWTKVEGGTCSAPGSNAPAARVRRSRTYAAAASRTDVTMLRHRRTPLTLQLPPVASVVKPLHMTDSLPTLCAQACAVLTPAHAQLVRCAERALVDVAPESAYTWCVLELPEAGAGWCDSDGRAQRVHGLVPSLHSAVRAERTSGMGASTAPRPCNRPERALRSKHASTTHGDSTIQCLPFPTGSCAVHAAWSSRLPVLASTRRPLCAVPSHPSAGTPRSAGIHSGTPLLVIPMAA
ncbi:hypothetical protein EON67_04670, partial [archaeon]